MTASAPGRVRPSWWQWMTVPWREWSLLGAIVAAAAAPVMLMASADVWTAATEDDVTSLGVEGADLDRNGIDVEMESRFDPTTVAIADVAMFDALGDLPRLSDADRTIYSLPGLVSLGPPPLRTVGPTARLVARAGALDAIDVVEQASDTAGGVWITTWFADRNGLGLGDFVAFEAGAIVDEQWNDIVQGGGAGSVFRVVGLYEPLWSPEPDHVLDEYWSNVPATIVPTFLQAFGGPNNELMITEEETLLASGLTGIVRWVAPLTSLPERYDELRGLRDRFRGFERDLVGTGPLSEAISDIATPAGGRPRLTTDLFDTVGSIESAAARVAAPLATAQGVGLVVGLIAMIAVGVFFVERRRTEFRLLAGEGDRSISLAMRVAAQLAVPVAIGGVAGAVAALVGPLWFGPAERLEHESLPWTAIVVTAVISLFVASAVAGAIAVRTLSPTPRATTRAVSGLLVVVLAIATLAAWLQVARTTNDRGTLDLAVIALPVLVVLVVAFALLSVVGWALRRIGGAAQHLPIEAYLAVRRLAGRSPGLTMMSGTLGLGVGLLVFAAAFTSTLDRTVEIKLTTEIGGESSANLIDDLPADFDAGAPTTVIGIFDTMLTPGGMRARIIAIDPATFVSTVSWPDQFGSDPGAVVEALSVTNDESIPMVAISGEPGPTSGAFGLTQAFPFRVVERIAAFPGAGDAETTLLVLADAVDEFALADAGYENRQAAADANFRLPTDRFRRRAISQATSDDLTDALDGAFVRYGDVTSRTERRGDPGIVATRSAYGYLGVIGVVAMSAALVAVALYLGARRRVRALTGVMTRSMGLSPGRSAAVSVIEVTTMMVVAVCAGFAAAPLLVRRLSDRFDPAPTRPPGVTVLVAWLPMLSVAAVAIVVLSAAIWVLERHAGRRSAAEVLRDGD